MRGTHQNWREHWNIEKRETVWSPEYGWGEVADPFTGGYYPILVSFKEMKDGEENNGVAKYYSWKGIAEDGSAIYPKSYAIALDAAADETEGVRRAKPPFRSKKEDAMIRAHKMLGESWKRAAQTMGMTPAQAFVDFSSNDVLLHFVDDIGNVYGVAMEELKRRMENGQYDSEGESCGDGNTDV